MEGFIISVNKKVIQKELEHEGVTVLSYKIEYPHFTAPHYQLSLSVINRFYEKMALEYQNYLETELFGAAVRQYEDDVKNGYPVRAFEALMTYNVKYKRICALSLYFDKYEYTGGAHGSTIRTSQTWNLQKCERVSLKDIFACGREYKEFFLEKIIRQIERNPALYFEDYEKRAEETFNPDSFYCTPRGVVIYYQQYDIAPYASGIREFFIPYGDCVTDPAKKCFIV